jgi:hypothetical protein
VVSREEIERDLVDAGWELDGSFSDYLLVGEDGDLSILVPRWAGEMDDPVYELCDGEREITSSWVGEIPTPQYAAMLLREHGGPPEEERGNPYKRAGDEEE